MLSIHGKHHTLSMGCLDEMKTLFKKAFAADLSFNNMLSLGFSKVFITFNTKKYLIDYNIEHIWIFYTEVGRISGSYKKYCILDMLISPQKQSSGKVKRENCY